MENKNLIPLGKDVLGDTLIEIKRILKKTDTVSYKKAIEEIKKSLLLDGETEEGVNTILKEREVIQLITEFQADLKLIKEMDDMWCKLQIRKLIENTKTKDLVKLGAIRTIWDWQRDIIGDDIEEIAVEYFIEKQKKAFDEDEDEGWEDDQED